MTTRYYQKLLEEFPNSKHHFLFKQFIAQPNSRRSRGLFYITARYNWLLANRLKIQNMFDVVYENSKTDGNIILSMLPTHETMLKDIDVVISTTTSSELAGVGLRKKTIPFEYYQSRGIEHLQLVIDDFTANISCELLAEFSEHLADFVNEGKNILVHCKAGRARSAMLVSLAICLLEKSEALKNCYDSLIQKLNPIITKLDTDLITFFKLHKSIADYVIHCVVYGKSIIKSSLTEIMKDYVDQASRIMTIYSEYYHSLYEILKDVIHAMTQHRKQIYVDNKKRELALMTLHTLNFQQANSDKHDKAYDVFLKKISQCYSFKLLKDYVVRAKYSVSNYDIQRFLFRMLCNDNGWREDLDSAVRIVNNNKMESQTGLPGTLIHFVSNIDRCVLKDNINDEKLYRYKLVRELHKDINNS